MPASSPSGARFRRGLIAKLVWFHRWLGIASCLVFALWFASGMVLLFEPFPSLPASEQQALAPPTDLAALAISPAQALEASGTGTTALRIKQRGAGPAYIATTSAGSVAIDGVSGKRLADLSAPEATGIVVQATHLPARAIGPIDYDQWVVHNQFDSLRPFYRVDVADGRGSSYYVSARTGDIVQHTTRWQRGWNWVGAVLHWVYFTPLRSSFDAWDKTVWIVSFICMWVAVAGAILGVVRTVAVRKARRPGLTFYRLRWMRWHHLAGLAVGLFVVTWILSGWLSMDHGRLFSRGLAGDGQSAAYTGLTQSQVADAVPLATLRQLGIPREVRLTALDGTPLIATVGGDGIGRLHSTNGSLLTPEQADLAIRRGLQAGWGSPVTVTQTPVAGDDFYGLAEGMMPGVWRYPGEDQRPTIYVDPGDGHLVTVMTTSRAAYAWIYYGLHSFNFPGLASHQWLRRIVMMLLLVPGFAFSVTGVVLGWQRMRKTIAPLQPKEKRA